MTSLGVYIRNIRQKVSLHAHDKLLSVGKIFYMEIFGINIRHKYLNKYSRHILDAMRPLIIG